MHIDLKESNEISLLSEFLFSILVTKFYNKNGKILYIPKDISIYIEIPNCYENYLSKLGILNLFKREHISFENLPKFNFPMEIIQIFNQKLGINTNEKLEAFVKKYIGIQKYSFYQIDIFIKFIINHLFSISCTKFKFLSNGKDVTDKIISNFSKCSQYFTNCAFSRILTKNKINNNLDILSETFYNDLRNMENPYILYYFNKEKMSYNILKITDSTEYFKGVKDYLKVLKEMLNLHNKVNDDDGNMKSLLSILREHSDDFVITQENFKKMVLILYRIIANIPLILMGIKDSGRKSLIMKLNQLLNNGDSTVYFIQLDPSTSDDYLCGRLDEIEEIEKREFYKNGKLIWVYFDRIDNYSSINLITEIFTKRSYNGKNISNRIRLIGSCSPYIKRKYFKKYGERFSVDNNYDNYYCYYLSNPLPQSLLYFVFSFSPLNEEDEKKYIYSNIENCFTKEENNLLMLATKVISKCNRYISGCLDPLEVSLGDLYKFKRLLYFFEYYFKRKNEYEKRTNNKKNNKLRSIICAIYLCYFYKLTELEHRNNFELEIRYDLLNLINNENIEEKEGNLIEQIKNKDLKNEILSWNEKIINNFSDFINIEQDYLINQIELEQGIGKNKILKENLFLMFVSILANIPLIIIGKPGTSKRLSIKLITESMKGIYSKNKFFRLFPNVFTTNFKGSEFTKPEDIQNLFSTAHKKLNGKFYKEISPDSSLSLILFDELKLAEESKFNPLKILYSILNSGQIIRFIGISNYSLYSLNTQEINKAIILNIPDLDRLDEIVHSTRNIVESISPLLLKNHEIFTILICTYYEYKRVLQIIKELMVYKIYINENKNKIKENEFNENIINFPDKMNFEEIKNTIEFKDLMNQNNEIIKDFHGICDFYNLIKGIANELYKIRFKRNNFENEKNLTEKIEKYIERNFGGIEYEIEIELILKLDDTEEIATIKKSFESYQFNNKKHSIKLSSDYLFKISYNLQCDKMECYDIKIDETKIDDYNINNCIIDNINDINSRFLLLEMNISMMDLIYQSIKLQNQYKDIKLYTKSSFIDDNNKDYIYEKINEILKDAKDDNIIIIKDFNEIHPYLSNLYNRNYQEIGNKKYAIIGSDKFEVNDQFKIIILSDENYIRKCDIVFLKKFEKINIQLKQLLNIKLMEYSNNLFEEIQIANSTKKYNVNINYSFKDIMINCSFEDIQGLVFYYYLWMKTNEDYDYDDIKQLSRDNNDYEKIKQYIINKIYMTLPQDIIIFLPEGNIIKKKYYELKRIYNLKNYIEENDSYIYKISIIYTFTRIFDVIDGLNKNMNLYISEIKSEKQLKNLITEIKNKNENNSYKIERYICFHCEQSDSKDINFISNFILHNYINDKYKYIMIVHINRKFNKENSERIYPFLNIDPHINQLFIDNLNGNEIIRFDELFETDIKYILNEYKEELCLKDEFYKILYDKENDNLDEKINSDEAEKMMETIFQLVDNYFENISNRDLFIQMCKNNYINKDSIDISSCLIKYIKDEIFIKYIKIAYKELEGKRIKNKIKKYLCRIKNQKSESFGLFCKVPFPDKFNLKEILIINTDSINEDISKKEKLTIKIEDEIKEIDINLKEKIIYINRKFNIAFIEMKEDFNKKIDFLECDYRVIQDELNEIEKNYLEDKVFTIKYIEQKLFISLETLKNIFTDNKNDYPYTQNDIILEDNIFPIINSKNIKLLGIYKKNDNTINIDLNCLIHDFIEIKYYIPLALNSFNINPKKEIIGKGTFGKVYLIGINKKKYALKQISTIDLGEEIITSIEKEAKILSILNSKYIVKYYDSFKDKNYFNIAMEYAGKSNLKSYIADFKKEHQNQLIDEKIIVNIIKQIYLGIKEIHKSKIIHRDLKPENIFINEKNIIKIGDFGISKILETNKKYVNSNVGTVYYMAPEILKREKYNNKVDLYAFGCIIYELFTLSEYYVDKIIDEKDGKINLDIYSKKWQELIDLCLKKNYHQRPTIEELSKYFN